MQSCPTFDRCHYCGWIHIPIYTHGISKCCGLLQETPKRIHNRTTKLSALPGFKNTLWSVPAFAQSGHRVIFEANLVRIVLNADQPDQKEIHIAPPFAHQSQIDYGANMAYANTAAAKQPDSTTNDTSPSSTTQPRRRVDLELLHARLGHQSIKSLLAASHDSIWEDTQIRFAPDSFCISCKIATRRTIARGHRPVSHPEYPGQILFMALIHNPSQTSITASTYFPYYLLIVCAYSRYGVFLGCNDPISKSIINCIKNFSVYHRPHLSYTLQYIAEIHADAGTYFTSQALKEWGLKMNIAIIIAGAHHQEMNGLGERHWQAIRH